MSRLEHLVGDRRQVHSHPPVYTASHRLLATAPDSDPDIFRRLVLTLAPPYVLLYVLHTPRGEGEPGRYESEPLTATRLEAFIDRFAGLLRHDGRFDLWAFAPEEDATVVWDRHNLLYGYGPIDRFTACLRSLGFHEGTPTVPSPHCHKYRAEYDADATALLADLDWIRKPLRPEDEQR